MKYLLFAFSKRSRNSSQWKGSGRLKGVTAKTNLNWFAKYSTTADSKNHELGENFNALSNELTVECDIPLEEFGVNAHSASPAVEACVADYLTFYLLF